MPKLRHPGRRRTLAHPDLHGSDGNGLIVAVSGDPERASAKVRAVLGAQPVIRRIAPFGGALGVPAALPSIGHVPVPASSDRHV